MIQFVKSLFAPKNPWTKGYTAIAYLPSLHGTVDLGAFTVPEGWSGICLYRTDSRSKTYLTVYEAATGKLVVDTQALRRERFTLKPGRYIAKATGADGNDILRIEAGLHHVP